jgi:enediyne biosynthesis protein E4
MLSTARVGDLGLRSLRLLATALLLVVLLGVTRCEPPIRLSFHEVAAEVGLRYEHGFVGPGLRSIEARISGGVASGDVDGDGFIDLYVVRGDLGPNLLFRNTGDGRFEEVSEAAGVAIDSGIGCGPLLADFDGDGDLDLLVGGVDGEPIHFFVNTGEGYFEERSAESGIGFDGSTFSAAAADFDRDGDLDLFLTHWGSKVEAGSTGHLWRNDGSAHFTDVSQETGVSEIFPVASESIPDNEFDFTFTPNFADVDADGWPDLLLTSDFGTTRLLRNVGGRRFEDVTPDAISDENGMGAAIGDFDGDLDLDWFVSSIYDDDIPPDANWRGSGNRLYRNEGDARFSDATDEAMVREGFWGWGSCFADFDLDGTLDLFHTNGFLPGEGFDRDPSRLFIGSRDGSFSERSAETGLIDEGNGRGVVCFDYDRDGDVDILVANNDGPPSLFRNDLEGSNQSLTVRLRGPRGNSEGIGARVYVSSPSLTRDTPDAFRFSIRTQLREIRAGSNYVSQNPAEAVFGLGLLRRPLDVRVAWPDGAVTIERGAPIGRVLVVDHPERRGLGSGLGRERDRDRSTRTSRPDRRAR